MSTTKIPWADKVWNPITGCSRSGSPGCDHCWAKRMANRLRGRYGYPKDDPFRVIFHPDRLDEPLHWKKPSRIFVCSMGDLFYYGKSFSVEKHHLDQREIFLSMKRESRHTYLLLTKRPENMAWWAERWVGWWGKIPENWWLGVSVENQRTADERIPILLQIPAAKRFVSVEPMLENVDLSIGLRGLQPMCKGCYCFKNFSYCAITKYGEKSSFICLDGQVKGRWNIAGLDWVLCGGETGPKARPMNPDWARKLRDDCQAAGVPFFFKQMSGKQPIPKDLMIREFPNG